MRKRTSNARRVWGSVILAAAVIGTGGASIDGRSVDQTPDRAPAPVHQPADPQDGEADDEPEYIGLATDGDSQAAATPKEDPSSKPAQPKVVASKNHAPDVPGRATSSDDPAAAAASKMVAPSEATGDTAKALRAALSGKHRIRVIVTMDKAVKAEADLSNSQVAAQRASIDKSLDGLAGVLAGTSSKVVTRFDVTPAAVAKVDAAGLDALLADPSVAAVTLDRELQLTLDSSTGVIDSDLLNAAGVRGNNFEGSTGGRFEVAILDSGTDNGHNAFAGRIVAQACFSTGNWCPNGTDQQIGGNAGDDCGYSTQCNHGTHVGGIASGAFYTGGHEGVADGTGIIAVQIGHRATGAASCGTGPDPCWRTFFSDMDQALQHVLNLRNGGRNVASVNLSIGGGGPSNNCDATLPNSQNLMTNLRAANVAVVVAAGNDSFNAGVSLPACLSSAFTISATDDADTPAFFTNSGTKTTWWAPGVNVVSAIPTGNNNASFNGTSMSTPHVAGGFALLRECVDGNGTPLTTNAIATRLNSSGPNVTRNGVTRRRINVLDAATSGVNNNDFSAAETLPGNATFNDFDFNVCADAEAGEPGPGSNENSVWWNWTPSATGTATISTENGGGNVTTFDTLLAVFTGNSLGSLSLVASDDDGGTTPEVSSKVVVPVNGGTTYRIRVDGFAAANGLLNLHTENGPPPTCFGVAATRVGTGFGDVINGTAGNDVIVGLAGDDTIHGNGGNDRICGEAGNDTIGGDDGNDFVLGGSGADRIFGDDGDDTLVGNAGGGNNDDVGDVINGGFGDDFIDGWVGDDTLQGGPDDDTIRGEAGNDTASYQSSGNKVNANLTTNTSTGAGMDTFQSIENLLGSNQRDVLIGNAAPNLLKGNGGDDDLKGLAGNDTYDGDAGIDRVSFSSSPAGVDARLSTGLATGEGNDTMAEVENLTGSSQADVLWGSPGANRLEAGNGNDTVRGGDGNDSIFAGGGGDDVKGHKGHDKVKGGGGNDLLAGDNGDDELSGEAGADHLNGGLHNDRCNGGTNNDTSFSCEFKVNIP